RTVKLKSEDRYHAFGPVELYREEIDQIVSLLIGGCESVELSAGKYIFDSLDEMASRLGKNFYQLQIRARTPDIRVSLGREQIYRWGRRDKNNIYTSDVAGALFFQVKDIISSHERTVLGRLFNLAMYFLIIIA